MSNGEAWWWPASAAGIGKPTPCHYLGDRGCTLSLDDRPVTCILYPLVFNKAGTLVNQMMTVFGNGVCKGNHGQGPPLIDALKPGLIALFGEDQYDRAREAVMAGGDAVFVVPPDVEAAYAAEVIEKSVRALPPPRSQR